MDFIYDFKQAQVDRYEEAGVKSYEKRQPQSARKVRKSAKPANRLLATIINVIR